jgi:hypothetical protein
LLLNYFLLCFRVLIPGKEILLLLLMKVGFVLELVRGPTMASSSPLVLHVGAEDENVEKLVPRAFHVSETFLFNTISGTQWRAPTWPASLLALSQYPKFAPADVEAALYDVATYGMIDLACSTPTADVGACACPHHSRRW